MTRLPRRAFRFSPEGGIRLDGGLLPTFDACVVDRARRCGSAGGRIGVILNAIPEAQGLSPEMRQELQDALGSMQALLRKRLRSTTY